MNDDYFGDIHFEKINESARLETENSVLKKIIAKELSENDDFGAEFVHVSILKDENAKLKAKLAKAIEQRDHWIKQYFGDEIERFSEINEGNQELDEL